METDNKYIFTHQLVGSSKKTNRRGKGGGWVSGVRIFHRLDPLRRGHFKCKDLKGAPGRGNSKHLVLRQEHVCKLFVKRPNGKYFQLCGPNSLYGSILPAKR